MITPTLTTTKIAVETTAPSAVVQTPANSNVTFETTKADLPPLPGNIRTTTTTAAPVSPNITVSTTMGFNITNGTTLATTTPAPTTQAPIPTTLAPLRAYGAKEYGYWATGIQIETMIFIGKYALSGKASVAGICPFNTGVGIGQTYIGADISIRSANPASFRAPVAWLDDDHVEEINELIRDKLGDKAPTHSSFQIQNLLLICMDEPVLVSRVKRDIGSGARPLGVYDVYFGSLNIGQFDILQVRPEVPGCANLTHSVAINLFSQASHNYLSCEVARKVTCTLFTNRPKPFIPATQRTANELCQSILLYDHRILTLCGSTVSLIGSYKELRKDHRIANNTLHTVVADCGGRREAGLETNQIWITEVPCKNSSITHISTCELHMVPTIAPSSTAAYGTISGALFMLGVTLGNLLH